MMRYFALTFMTLLLACGPAREQQVFAAGGNMVQNASFEEGNDATPQGWMAEKRASNKGSISLSDHFVHNGKRALMLVPNNQNKGAGIASNPLGIGQGYPPKGLLGKKLYVSAWMGAEGNATAIVGLYAYKKNGSVDFVELRQSAVGSPTYHEDSLVVPDASDVLFVIINCHAEGQSGAAYFDDVYVSEVAPSHTASAPTPKDLAASVTVDAKQDIRRIPDTIYGANIEWIWDGNGLWDAEHNRLDPRMVELTRAGGVTQLRFPGGIFADFYHWKDGIGPQASRKTTESMPGGTQSIHHFGTDEALELSKATGAPLMITANIVTGTVAEAVEWLRYIKQRTGPGKAPPVTYWELGNENYVNDGSPHSKAGTMKPSEYARRVHEFSQALRAADPSIKIGAVTDENFGATIPHAYPTWSEEILPVIGKDIDFLSVHNGYAPLVIDPKGRSVREIYGAMLAAPVLIDRSLARTSNKIENLANDRSGRIKIAITEWGPFFHLDPNSPFVDHVKTLGSALYAASMFKTFIEAPRVDVADFFKLSDQLFMGWVGKRQGEWTPKAPFLALEMFRKHFGAVAISSSAISPRYDSVSAGWVDAVTGVPYVDLTASRSEDRKKLYIMAINKNFDSDIPLQVELQHAATSKVTVWTLSGTGLDANTGTQLFQAPGIRWAKQAADKANPRFDRGGPSEVVITSKPLQATGTHFSYSLPKASVTSFEIDVQ